MATRNSWFGVDADGLASVLERKGKAWIVSELVSNAWDSPGVTRVEITVAPIEGVPYANVRVVDDSPEGWTDIADSFTMFARSRRGGDAERRGRFGMGEKLVLACCRVAQITTTTGRITFTADGKRHSSPTVRTVAGTDFDGEVRITRQEIEELELAVSRMIPPEGVTTIYNGRELTRPPMLARFEARLPTVLLDPDQNLRPTTRLATVEAFPAGEGEGDVLELGVPVQACAWPWRLNVLQKIPLGFDRDSITEAFRKALQVAALNVLASTVPHDQVDSPWVSETISDGRATSTAVIEIIRARFGDKAVIATPGDPIANAQAAAAGAVVVHGGSLPAGAWSNVRKHGILLPTSSTHPSAKPSDQSNRPACESCGRPL